jgi:hypothetical protein
LALAPLLSGCSLFSLDGLTDGKRTGGPSDGAVNSSLDSAPNDSAPADAGALSLLSDGTVAGADSSSDSSTSDGSTSGHDVMQREIVDGSVASDATAESTTSDGAITDAVATDSSVTVVTRSDGSTCKDDLSNIGTANFDVSFTLTTVQTNLVALVNQRSACNGSDFWDVRMNGGTIAVEVSDQANDTSFGSNVTVNDGRSHDVSIRRASEALAVYVDGVESGPNSAPISFGSLAPVSTGTDRCAAGVASFVGAMTNLCIASP